MPVVKTARSGTAPCIGAVVAVAMMTGAATAQEWKPAKNVDIVVASAAGGSSDRTARVVQKLLQNIPAIPSVSVTNRPGGGGTIAWTFLAQHPGDGHYFATFSPTILTNHILGTSRVNYREFTPLNIWRRTRGPRISWRAPRPASTSTTRTKS